MLKVNAMKNIVIIGASGHGSMLLDCLEKEKKYNVIGFIDSFKKKGKLHDGYEILGSEGEIPQLIKERNLEGAIIAIGNNFTRKCMVDELNKIAPSLFFVSTIHPSANIGRNVKVGKGSVIMPGVIINANAEVGEFCILNTNASLGHDGTMADFSSIASGSCTGGNLKLGEFSAISLGVNIIEKINIGEHSIVGAGALVVKDVGDFSVVYGVPARFIRSRKMWDSYLSGDSVSNNRLHYPVEI